MKKFNRFTVANVSPDCQPTPAHKYGVFDLLNRENDLCFKSKAAAVRHAKLKNKNDGGIFAFFGIPVEAVPFNENFPYRILLNGQPVKSFKTNRDLEHYIWDRSENFTIETFSK